MELIIQDNIKFKKKKLKKIKVFAEGGKGVTTVGSPGGLGSAQLGTELGLMKVIKQRKGD